MAFREENNRVSFRVPTWSGVARSELSEALEMAEHNSEAPELRAGMMNK